jgi:hypothetical protein
MPIHPDEAKPVLIMGAGTVGNRAADLLLSLGFQVKLAKYDAGKDTDGQYEIKTRELKDVYDRHPGAKVQMYAARGSDAEARIERLDDAGFNCRGTTDDIDFKNISLCIDASNGRERRNISEVYQPNDVPFALNGGSDPTLVNRRFFASFPDCPVTKDLTGLLRHDALITSCNTHCVSTAVSLLRQVLGKEEFAERVRDITVTFCRRHEDPHKGKAKPEFTSMKVKDYHLDEIVDLVPETSGLINSVVSKWPTEYFHTLVVDFDFHGPVSDKLISRYRRAIENYRRCIAVTDEVSHEKTIQAAHWAGIEDGDIPFPVYLVDRVSKYKLKLLALTPQRGIVAPSTVDYVLMRTGVCRSWQEAFDLTNEQGRYRGKDFMHLKNALQYNLEPRVYERLRRTLGSDWRSFGFPSQSRGEFRRIEDAA